MADLAHIADLVTFLRLSREVIVIDLFPRLPCRRNR